METKQETKTSRPTLHVREYGQSLWLDYIRRSMLEGGDLQRLVERDGLRGLTSNPAIFQKAIGTTDEYDAEIEGLLKEDPDRSANDLYEAVAIKDLQMACDILRPVYDETGSNGFCSLEVSPHLAHDTEATIKEAHRLWNAVNRPNLMIKVPSTAPGIPAIEQLLADGLNINVTLMFSLEDYENVAQAYISGLARADRPEQVHSVASFFVSRLSVKVDHLIEERDLDVPFDGGDVAIANAKMAYRRFEELFYGDDFAALKEKGAYVQRPLWASTSTKNPSYSDVRYVETLIGPDTVNTLPPDTLDAFRDHGEVRGATIKQDVDEAEALINSLSDHGLDLEQITAELQKEGVEKFVAPFDELLDTIEEKHLS